MNKDILISAKRNKNGSYSIFLQYCKEGVYLKTTGITVRLNENQLEFLKRKNKLPSTVPNFDIFNNKIFTEQESLEGILDKYFQNYASYPSKSELVSYIKYCNPDRNFDNQSFLSCFQQFVNLKTKSKDVKQYTTLLHHFDKFITWKNPKKGVINFSDLHVGFFKEFFTFLSMKNTILTKGKKNQLLGVCDNAIIKLSYNLASAINGIRKYKIASIRVEEIIDNIHLALEELHVRQYVNRELTLSHHEVEVLLNFNLSSEFRINKNGSKVGLKVSAEVLERIKYLFILQITKGTRHSDLHQICLEKVFDNKIDIIQKKTLKQYMIKIDEFTIDLMDKGQSERKISNQKYNEYLKLVFKQFFPYYKENFKKDDSSYTLDNILIIKNYLGVPHKEFKNRFELVKTHTARRTFVTVAKFEKKLPDEQIQKLIGQTNPASLKPYKIEPIEQPEVFDIKIKD